MHPSGTLLPDEGSHWSREKHVDCVYYWELLLEHNVLYVAVGLDETTIYTRTAHDREIAVFDALGGGGGTCPVWVPTVNRTPKAVAVTTSDRRAVTAPYP